MLDPSPHRSRRSRRPQLRTLRTMAIPAVLAAMLLSSCGADDGAGDAAPDGLTGPELTLAIASASFDLTVGEDRRLILAVFTDQRERVAGGTITVRLAHLGDEPGGQAPLGAPLTATFLPISGLDIAVPERGPAVVGTDVLTGVYRLDVDLDAAGFWGASVTAELVDVGTVEGRTVFRVLEARRRSPSATRHHPRPTSYARTSRRASHRPPRSTHGSRQPTTTAPRRCIARASTTRSLPDARS